MTNTALPSLLSPARRIWRHPALRVLVLALFALFIWALLLPAKDQTGKKPNANLPVAVGIARVKQQDVPQQLTALGTVNSTYTVTVHSRVDGQLMKIHFTEGQQVKEGELLAELDPRPFQAAVDQIKGQLAHDQAVLKAAELDLARYLKLQPRGFVSGQQTDSQRALVLQAQGSVQQDLGQLANARLQLDYSKISAPVSGRVGLRLVDPGNIVHSNDTNGLVMITQEQPINVLFSVPETSLTQVLQAARQNPALKVEAWDRDDSHKLADGTLLAIDNQLNTSTGTVSIKARFANEQQQLFPNQFVNVHLQLGDRHNALTIPTVAIQTGKQGNFVYRVNADQTVSINNITTGPAYGDMTLIEQGLEPGQSIVTEGIDKLRNLAKVRVITPDDQSDRRQKNHPLATDDAINGKQG